MSQGQSRQSHATLCLYLDPYDQLEVTLMEPSKGTQ